MLIVTPWKVKKYFNMPKYTSKEVNFQKAPTEAGAQLPLKNQWESAPRVAFSKYSALA